MGEVDQGRSEAKRGFLFSFCKMGERVPCQQADEKEPSVEGKTVDAGEDRTAGAILLRR